MIQRKQSILILMVALGLVALNLFLPPSKMFNASEQVKDFFQESILRKTFQPITILGTVIVVLELFVFKNRSLQMLVGRIAMFINIYLVGVVVYWSLKVSGGVYTPEKGIWIAVLALNVCLLAISNKWIKKDDNLVKSVDRIR